MLVIQANVSINRKHTLSGNEVDFLNNAGTIRGKKYTA